MEGGSIIEPHLGELEEVLDVTRCVVRVEPNLDLAERRRNGDARIDFLELHGHDENVARRSFGGKASEGVLSVEC